MDLSFFIGRFHLALVHLPIGLLLLAVIMQFLSRKKRFEKLDSAIAFSLFLGATSAILAAICGWLLANNGAYVDRTLFLHRWLGIGVAILAGLCWLLKTKKIKTESRVLNFSVSILMIMIFYTGHLGGNLTHGKGYLLQYAPDVLKTVFGSESGVEKIRQHYSNPDSTFVFNDLLLPFLKEKCGDCHDEKDKKGGLDLTTKESFLKGGDHDEIFLAGNAYESEIFKRITLPGNDKKFMPPGGEALSYDQIRLLEWWINEGASIEKAVSEYDLPKDIETLFEKNYSLEIKTKSFVETLIVPPISDAVFQKLEAQNFKVTRLAANNNLLEISLQSGLKNITNTQIETLLQAKDQITWLNLGNAEILDKHLPTIQQLQYLTRLRLEQTSVSDQRIALLEGLPNLESLNLYGTSVSDQSIASFIKMSALKNIYLWQTKVSSKGLEMLKSQRPNLEVVVGTELLKENGFH
jgi:uncharacterized membrane protein/mono/diheme cytochrome c family protein